MINRMKNYEEIISLIINKRKDLTREEIEKKIEEKIHESRFLNKLGAALILAEELNVFPDYSIEKFEEKTLTTRIIDLVSGLKNVAIIGRVLFITPLRKIGQHSYIFGKIGDKTGKINLIDLYYFLTNGKSKEYYITPSVQVMKTWTAYEGGIIKITFTVPADAPTQDLMNPLRSYIEVMNKETQKTLLAVPLGVLFNMGINVVPGNTVAIFLTFPPLNFH